MQSIFSMEWEMFYKFIISISLILTVNTLFSFEITRISGTQTKVAYAGTAERSSVNKNYQISQRIVAPEKVTGYIPFNRKVGILTFTVLVPQRSIVYMKWDNENALYSRIGKMVKFRRAGEYRSISFNATKLMSGFIYFYNANKKLLGKVHYQIKKQNAYSQNLRSYVRDTTSGTDDSKSTYAGIAYSISQRVNIGDPRLSMGVSVSTDVNNSSSRTINASVSYSW